MRNRIPEIFTGSRICIICEGDEEYGYLEKLISLDVWSKAYRFQLENAEGNGNIPARYQDKYQNGTYDLVLIFCDTDRKPYEQYVDIKRKVNEFHGIENAADQVVIFGNPCTMQIIIEHWGDVTLSSNSKKRNAPVIFDLTGVEGYKGKREQRQELFSGITKENYQEMRERIKKLPSDDTLEGSTNFGKFLDYFSMDDSSWIELMNNTLNG
ncbi:MAG: hypothetical protein NC432_08470 [Roseburia sp.]|nr:hypothetical protein [Roseburia sp.]MCM1099059.1 hypothetical protein [Ruminococcus flavefaciens]